MAHKASARVAPQNQDTTPPDVAEPGPESFDLEDYIPFLVRRITPYTDSLIATEMDLLGVNPEIMRIMLMLQRHGPQNLSDLAEMTLVNISTLSRLIGRMQKQQLVERRSGGYGRTVEITLLPAGERKIEGMIPAMRGLQDRLTAMLTADELVAVKSTLGQLYAISVRMVRDHGEAMSAAERKKRRTPKTS